MLKLPFHISIPDIKPRFNIVDVIIFIFIGSVLIIILFIASQWKEEMQPSIEINLDPSYIPFYALNSIFRIGAAYILSFLFAIWFGYTANKSKWNERIMIPLLDIFQSIPVLSFLPGVVHAMIAIFPNSRIGIELSSILLIFTGQVWNMAFSYYNSINTLPRELKNATIIYGLTKFQRFLKLDLPYSAIGLIWNSMMSVAGGWFFLMACEMFVLGDRDFRLPGIGSYIQTAADKGDLTHIIYGLATMIFIIIIFDIFLWKPLVAWSQKFKLDTVKGEEESESFVLNLLRRSTLKKYADDLFNKVINTIEQKLKSLELNTSKESIIKKIIIFTSAFLIIMILFISAVKMAGFFIKLPLTEYLIILKSTLFSFLRTFLAIFIASLWTIPVGVMIGMNKRVARFAQPLVQIVASVPATAVFPVIILFLIKIGGGLDIGAIFLMLMGTQWYILFNVIAGASAIPQDLKDAIEVYNIKGIQKWKTLILPCIFPYLITGLITATGGAWNATIVAEYVTFSGETLKTIGLGALISEATVKGNFQLLLISTITMAIVVVSINRLLWKRLFQFARERYSLE